MQSCIPTVVLPSLRLDYLAIIHIVTILLAPEVTSSLLMSAVMGMLWVSVFMVTPRITTIYNNVDWTWDISVMSLLLFSVFLEEFTHPGTTS